MTTSQKDTYDTYQKKHAFDYAQRTILIYSPQEVDNAFLEQFKQFDKAQCFALLRNTMGLTGHNEKLKTQWSIYIFKQLADMEATEKNHFPENKNLETFIATKLIDNSFYSAELIDWMSGYLYEKNHPFLVPNTLVSVLIKSLLDNKTENMV